MIGLAIYLGTITGVCLSAYLILWWAPENRHRFTTPPYSLREYAHLSTREMVSRYTEDQLRVIERVAGCGWYGEPGAGWADHIHSTTKDALRTMDTEKKMTEGT